MVCCVQKTTTCVFVRDSAPVTVAPAIYVTVRVENGEPTGVRIEGDAVMCFQTTLPGRR